MEPPQLPPQPLSSPASTLELKAVCSVTTPTSSSWIEDKYSSYTQLLHITAWSLCFLDNLKAKMAKASLLHTPSLSLSEINSAEILLFSFSQQCFFIMEICRIAAGESLRPSSPLLSLNPTIGSGGLLTVGRRLKNSSLSPSQKHPIILHGKDALTNLLVCSKHLSLLHSYCSLF